MNRHKKDKGRIAGPFVPMLVATMKSPAWKAMSANARVVYIALKSKYGIEAKNNGRIYLSARDGTEETGLGKNVIARALREVQYYGFIAMTEPGCLGLDGRGKAPHWRLTELGYMTDPPTRDFMRWDGVIFHEQKSPGYYKRQERRLAQLTARKKQNPVPTSGTPCPDVRYIPLSRRPGHLPNKLSRRPVHTADPACTDVRDISRLTTPPGLSWPVTLLPPGPASLAVVADFYARFNGANEAEKRKGRPTYPRTLGTGTVRRRPAPSPLQFMASSL
jgi:hypothetical protein